MCFVDRVKILFVKFDIQGIISFLVCFITLI